MGAKAGWFLFLAGDMPCLFSKEIELIRGFKSDDNRQKVETFTEIGVKHGKSNLEHRERGPKQSTTASNTGSNKCTMSM